MAIIVNADDFGYSHEINLAICEAFQKGLINRTTLMVNMPCASEAMDMAREMGFSDRVGLHLNLTAGKPLSSTLSRDAVMCDENGEFTADFARNVKTRFFLPKKTRKCVEEEIGLQLEKYRELGGMLWHVDSHHHVHTDPSVWMAFCKVVKMSNKDNKKSGFPVSSVRLGRNMYKGGNPILHFYKVLLNSSIRRFCKMRSDYFGSANDFENYFGKSENASKATLGLNIEIMVHPMYSKDGRLTDSMEPLKQYKERSNG